MPASLTSQTRLLALCVCYQWSGPILAIGALTEAAEFICLHHPHHAFCKQRLLFRHWTPTMECGALEMLQLQPK